MTVTEFKNIVDSYAKEIGCTGETTGSHSYPSDVSFWVGDKEYTIKSHDARRHMGCDCWTGIEFELEEVVQEPKFTRNEFLEDHVKRLLDALELKGYTTESIQHSNDMYSVYGTKNGETCKGVVSESLIRDISAMTGIDLIEELVYAFEYNTTRSKF